MGWTEFALAFGAFFLTHALPVRPPIRARLEMMLGRPGFTLAYSALSLAVLAWLIGAAGRAPRVPLWGWAAWQPHVVLAATLPACLILALAVGRPNPFSFGGARNERFDPAHPGIVGWIRHPVPAALTLWAGAHLAANGDLAHVLLFGGFTVFAILGPLLIDRRNRRRSGNCRTTAGVLRRPPLRSVLSEAPLRVAGGIALWLGLLTLHPVVIGVSPLP